MALCHDSGSEPRIAKIGIAPRDSSTAIPTLFKYLGALAALLASLAAPTTAGGNENNDFHSKLEGCLQAAYRSAKLKPPKPDSLLAAAALALARKAAEKGTQAATDSEEIMAELSNAGAWDPAPRVIALRIAPASKASDYLGARQDLASAPASHFGAAIVPAQNESAFILLILADRKADLSPFQRIVEVGERETLSGQLSLPFYDATVFVTDPGMRVSKIPTEPTGRSARDQFKASISFAKPGPYTVEVMAQSMSGPQVVAIFRVQSGKNGKMRLPASVSSETSEAPELDPIRAQEQVLGAINKLRKSRGLRPLRRDKTLDSVAAEHSREMARLGYFAHVSPISGNVAQRVNRAGLAYQRVAENIGKASSAMEAHALLERSPGHLANLLEPEVDLVGIGTADIKEGSIENVLLTEVFLGSGISGGFGRSSSAKSSGSPSSKAR